MCRAGAMQLNGHLHERIQIRCLAGLSMDIGSGVPEASMTYIGFILLLLFPFRARCWHLRRGAGCQGVTEPHLSPLLNNRGAPWRTLDATKIACVKANSKPGP